MVAIAKVAGYKRQTSTYFWFTAAIHAYTDCQVKKLTSVLYDQTALLSAAFPKIITALKSHDLLYFAPKFFILLISDTANNYKQVTKLLKCLLIQ